MIKYPMFYQFNVIYRFLFLFNYFFSSFFWELTTFLYAALIER